MAIRTLGHVLFIGAIGAAPAPLAAQARVTFGPMAGVSVVDWHGADAGEASSLVRFTAGGFVRVRQSDLLAIEPQVLYVQKGSKLNVGTGGPTTVKLDYVEVPVLFSLNVPTENSAVHPHFFAGPALAFKTGCTVSGEGTAAAVKGSCDDSTSAVKSTDFSFVFGLGFQVRRFDFQLRYDLGFTRISDIPGRPEISNQAFLITLGIGF